MLVGIHKALIFSDRFCDKIPFVSTGTNLFDLFIKHIYPNAHATPKNYYTTYIKEKSTYRSLALLLPVIGNVGIVIWDRYHPQTEKDTLLKSLNRGDIRLGQLPTAYRDDDTIVKASVSNDASHLREASKRLRNNEEVLRAAAQSKYRAPHTLDYCHSDWLENRELIMLVAHSWDETGNFNKIRQAFRDDIEIMNLLMSKDAGAYFYASDRVKANPGFKTTCAGMMEKEKIVSFAEICEKEALHVEYTNYRCELFKKLSTENTPSKAMLFHKRLISYDRLCDKIPIISTISSLVNLYIKHLLLDEFDKKNYYYTYLEEKSSLRSLALLLPVIGNISVVMWDHYHPKKEKDILLKSIKNGTIGLYHLCHEYQDVEAFVLPAVLNSSYNLQYASERLRNDKTVIFTAAQNPYYGYCTLEFCNPKWRKNRELVLSIAKHHYINTDYIDPIFYDDLDIMKLVIAKNLGAYNIASEQVKNDPDFIRIYNAHQRRSEKAQQEEDAYFRRFFFGSGTFGAPTATTVELPRAIESLQELKNAQPTLFTTTNLDPETRSYQLRVFAQKILTNSSARSVMNFSQEEQITPTALKKRRYQLLLKYAPDKNLTDATLATEVFKWIEAATKAIA